MLRGRAWKFGDNVDTDIIIPARYLTSTDPTELGAHCMTPADPDFPQKVRPGDFVVAGQNFGCGSSREHAPLALRGAGVAAVIAVSFARIFFRNAINIGLPIMECPQADAIRTGDELEVDPGSGLIRNLTRGEEYRATPLPPFLREIIEAGGLVPYVRREVRR